MAWQLQKARQRLAEVVRRALERGPQVITRYGEKAVVVVSIDQFEELDCRRPDFKEFLRAAPDLGRLRISRPRRPSRRCTTDGAARGGGK